MGWFRRDRDRAGQSREAAAEKAFERGRREFAAGRFGKAATVLREVVALTPDSPSAQFLLGAALFNAGDSKAAIDPLRRCIAMRPEHAEAHFALGMSLARVNGVDQIDQAVEHIAKGASLGDQQALEMLPKVGADFCRKCAGPARFARGDADADIVIMTPRTGMSCVDCHLVLCGTCATRGETGPMRPTCPDCGGLLHALMMDG